MALKLMFFFTTTYRLKGNPRLDHRCSSTGCWYCKDRCHICMDLAIQGYTLFPSKGLMFKHCSEECKAMVDEVPHFSVQVHPAHSLNPRGVILVSIKGCLASVMSTHTIVEVHVCISMERTSIDYGRPLANVQLRTQDQHTFFSVYLSDDFSPTEPANSFPAAFSFQMLKDSGILGCGCECGWGDKVIQSWGKRIKCTHVVGAPGVWVASCSTTCLWELVRTDVLV